MQKILMIAMIVIVPGFNAYAQTATSSNTSQSSSLGQAASIINQNFAGNPANTINTEKYQGSYTINNVPNQATLIETPTAPCMVPMGATVSVAGFGGGAVGAYTSKECTSLEAIRMTWNMQQPQIAYLMMCRANDIYRAARADAGQPCPASTYPNSNNTVATNTAPIPTVKPNAAEIKLASNGLEYSSPTDNIPVRPKAFSEKQQFCSQLNPNDPEDQPYIKTDCTN